MGSPTVGVSSSHRPLRSPKHARNQQCASQWSVLSKSLEICFFLAGGKDSRERSRGVPPQPMHPMAAPPSPAASLFHSRNSRPGPLPVCPAVWKCTPKRQFFRGHEFSLYPVLHYNKSCSDRVPPLERSHVSTPVRYQPQFGLTLLSRCNKYFFVSVSHIWDVFSQVQCVNYIYRQWSEDTI